MPKTLVNLALLCVLAVIAVQLMLNTLADAYPTVGYSALWVVPPATLLFAAGVWVLVRYIVPLTLYKGHYLLFLLLTFSTSYILMIAFLGMETVVSGMAGIPPRAPDWAEPAIYLERFCDSTVMTIVLLGTAAYAAYREWLRVSEMEQSLAETLRSYVSTVRTRLDRDRIARALDEIRDVLRNEDMDAAEAIGNLSDYLRRQLYELPPPPSGRPELSKESAGKVADFLIGKKWRKWRHIAFQILLVIMSTEFFFRTPSKIEITPEILLFAFIWYLFLNLLVALNRFWLYRRYRRHRSGHRYLVEAALVITVPFILFLVVNIVGGSRSISEVFNPWLIVVLSTLGALLSMVLFEVGITVVFLMKFRAQGKMRTEAFAAETARQEYLFLKKQINPHFLFNVLNNINILSYDDRDEALEMLAELRRLIDYQFAELSEPFTTAGREYTFLNSYLGLEASRTDNLVFSLSWVGIERERPIPTLLFIPIVENAVKHSKGVRGRREVSVLLTETEREILFECSNNYVAAEGEAGIRERSGRPGGLGLTNLRRRLELLYGEEAMMTTVADGDTFTVALRLPEPTV